MPTHYPTESTLMNKQEVLSILRSRNIVRVEVEFSGGNDEGGADSINAYTANGERVDLAAAPSNVADQGVTGAWTVWEAGSDHIYNRRPATATEIAASSLTTALEEPVYAEYGSFAGEFYVSGTVTWDVVAGTVKMRRSEQVMTDMGEQEIDY